MWCDVVNILLEKLDFVPTARDLVQLASNNFTLARKVESDNNHAVFVVE